MPTSIRSTSSFPFVSLPSHCGGLPVEVTLIAQLGHGGGDRLIADASARQRAHGAFIDALDEPSVRLGGMDLGRGDATSLYSFVIGSAGHPFHRHAGHRVFTAVAGSAGTQLRFSTASSAQIAADPASFVRALHYVDIPPDSLFSVRFGGGTWHQFVPLQANSRHPALFALSCHTDELGGALDDALRQRVVDNRADIPALTEMLPLQVSELLEGAGFDATSVPTFALSLAVSPVSWLARLCTRTRGLLGRARSGFGRQCAPKGYLSDNRGGRDVESLSAPPTDSLLRSQLAGRHVHEDTFQLITQPGELGATSAGSVLACVLDGFLESRPLGVSQLMTLRNVLVRPLGLRTSPLGCPASSLLSASSEDWFAGRFPVLAQSVDSNGRRAQVILGADDRHLSFRSCVGVELLADGTARCTLGTRVQTRNLFGRIYMAVIDRVHRRYIAPTMLRLAVDHAVRSLHGARIGSVHAITIDANARLSSVP